MQTVNCLPVKTGENPKPTAKAPAAGGARKSFAAMLEIVSSPGGSAATKSIRASAGAAGGSGSESSADPGKTDTGGAADASVNLSLLASLVVNVQAAGMAKAGTPQQPETTPGKSAALKAGENSAQSRATPPQVITKGQADTQMAPAQVKAQTSAGTMAQPGQTDAQTLPAASAAAQQPSGIGIAGQQNAFRHQGLPSKADNPAQTDVKAGTFTVSPAPQENVPQAVVTQHNTGLAYNGALAHVGGGVARPDALQGAQSTSVMPERPVKGEGAAAQPTQTPMSQASGYAPQPQTVAEAAAGGANVLGEAAGITVQVQQTKALNVSASNVSASNVSASSASASSTSASSASASSASASSTSAEHKATAPEPAKQDGQGDAAAVRSVQSPAGSKEGQGKDLSKDGGRGARQDTPDASTAIGILGVKTFRTAAVEMPRADKTDMSGIARQISDAFKSADGSGKSEIRVHLSPQELGGINIRIVSQGGALSLSITADNHRTGEMLASNLGELTRSMNDNGVNMNKVEVFSSGTGAFDQGSGSYQDGRQNSGGDGSMPAWVQVAGSGGDNDPLPLNSVNNGVNVNSVRMSIFA